MHPSPKDTFIKMVGHIGQLIPVRGRLRWLSVLANDHGRMIFFPVAAQDITATIVKMPRASDKSGAGQSFFIKVIAAMFRTAVDESFIAS